MAVLTWNNAYKVSSFRWNKLRRDVLFSSIFGSQALEGGSPLWEVDIQGAPQMNVEAHAMVAFLESLEGYRNQLALWNLAQPQPVGTMRGTMTLSSSAAQGAGTLAVASTSDVELVSNGTFDADVSGWASSPTFQSSAAWVGGEMQVSYVSASARQLQTIPTVPGRQYTMTVTQRRVTGTGSGYFGMVTAGGSNVTVAASSASTTNVTRSVTFTATATTTTIALAITTSGDVFAFDNVSVREALAGRTLLAGDLLGIGSGPTQQVVRVTVDAVSNASGVITVSIGTPLCNAFTAGAAVIWDRPKALFRQKSANAGIEYTPGIGQPWSLSLVEDWRS
jgi:hypothetical protein